MLRPKKEKQKREKLSKDSIKKAKRVFTYLKPYRGLYLIGWGFLVISSLLGLLFPLLMGQLLGTGAQEDSSMSGMMDLLRLYDTNTIALGLFILFGLQALFGFLRIIIFTNVTENALRDLRKSAFNRLLYMPMDFFNQNKVGELTSRMSSDVEKIQETLRTTIAEFFRQLVIIIGGVTFLFILSSKLALIMLGTLPVMIIIAVFFGRFIKKLSKQAQDEAAASNSIIEESLMGISNVKSFTREAFMLGKYSKTVETIRSLNIKSGLWRGFFASFIILCLFGAIVFIIWQGIIMTQGPNPTLSSDDFYSFIMLTVFMGASFGSIPELYASIQRAIGATENLMNIIETENEQDLLKGTKKPKISGEVMFENVSFSYPQRKDIAVLNNVSFQSSENQTIALVGSSGAGKSTIASLLLNYYPLSNGRILFNGESADQIDIEHLRDHMALVPQDVILFAGTIKENISFGNPDASDDQIKEAAIQANAWDFIEGFPENLNTEVGDRGIQLSGGQKQRIAIARAILRDPAILILDEATSALDSESEKLVQEALNKLMDGRTSFVIAHRLSTIKNADKIIVLDQGEIKETGTHDELIQKSGIYANLVKLQGVEMS